MRSSCSSSSGSRNGELLKNVVYEATRLLKERQ